MIFAQRYVPALCVLFLAMTATTPAQAHGGMEVLLFLGVVALTILVVGSVAGFFLFYMVIHFTWWRIRVRAGNKEDVNVIIVALLSVICVVAADAAVITWYLDDMQAKSAAETSRLNSLQDRQDLEVPPPENILPPRPGDAEHMQELLASGPHDYLSAFELGKRYRRGFGVAQDFAEAYYWLSICALQPPEGHGHKKGAEAGRKDSRERLTPEQSAAVDARIAEWQKNNPP